MVNQILHLTTNLHSAMNHSCFSIKIGESFHVYIFNDLNKDTLSLCCKSKDDDLGGYALPVEANFHFTFKVNFWGTTLFWCNFNWGKNHGGSYDIFWHEDDLLYRCGYKTKNCTWYARNDGIYLMGIPDSRYINFYYWKR